MFETVAISGVLVVMGTLTVANAIETLSDAFKGRDFRYRDPSFRVKPLDYLPRDVKAEVRAEGGELGAAFWSQFLKAWLDRKRPADELFILFGPTLQMMADSFFSYYEKFEATDPNWTRCHPVLEHWYFNDKANIKLYLKTGKSIEGKGSTHDLNETHKILVNGKEKVVLLEDKHYSGPPAAGRFVRRNDRLYQEMLTVFQDKLRSDSVIKLERDSFSKIRNYLIPEVKGVDSRSTQVA